MGDEILPVTALLALHVRGRECIVSASGNQLVFSFEGEGSASIRQTVLVEQTIHFILHIKTLDRHHENWLMVYGGRQVALVTLYSTDELDLLQVKVVDHIYMGDWILCAETSSENPSVAYLLTSNNVLIETCIDFDAQALCTSAICTNLGTFLYSACIEVIDRHFLLIASGTAFGEILTWSCRFDESLQAWTSHPWRNYLGHKGSIFGLCISPLLGRTSTHILASCSDDRTVLLWDLDGLLLHRSSLARRDQDMTSNLFETCEKYLTKTWAHLSRVWHINIFSNMSGSLILVSAGEDGQIQTWQIEISPESVYTLSPRDQDRHHTGKNIWAVNWTREEQITTYYSGGADGRIVSRRTLPNGQFDAGKQDVSLHFSEIFLSKNLSASSNKLDLKMYNLGIEGMILATTGDGKLIQQSNKQLDEGWRVLYSSPGVQALTICQKSLPFGLFAFDPTRKAVFYVEVNTANMHYVKSYAERSVSALWTVWHNVAEISTSWKACLVVYRFGDDKLELLWVKMSNSQMYCQTTRISLPKAFLLTSAIYDPNATTFCCGSRTGEVAIYREVTAKVDHAVTATVLHVHENDCVTSLKIVSALNNDVKHNKTCYILSTGRDGAYCVLQHNDSSDAQVMHQARPPFGPYLEQAYLVSRKDAQPEVLLSGFHGRSFVVWNETQQLQVMSVDCGGAHRSWAFQPERDSNGGTFVWTQAGAFRSYQQKKESHAFKRTGGHGREIKALASHRRNKSDWLIATGSEDTDIRLFQCDPRSTKLLKHAAVLRRHTTGLQALRFIQSGSILISAGGMEELFAWRLSHVPVIGQAAVFCGQWLQDGPTSDARIMSISVKDTSEMSTTIAVALSSGMIRLLRFTQGDSTTADRFELLGQVCSNTICITQVCLLYSHDEELRILHGATNGRMGLTLISPSSVSDEQSTTEIHKVHDNAITSMVDLVISESLNLVVTAGDDNSLVFTLICENQTSTFTSIRIPKAHAAAITAIAAFHSPQNQEGKLCFTFLTGSNDQRIIIWCAKIDLGRLRDGAVLSTTDIPECIDIIMVGERYTNVADLSSIQILSDESESVQTALIAGVGMELVEIDRYAR